MRYQDTDEDSLGCGPKSLFFNDLAIAVVEAAGIEPYPAFFEKRRRRATFVVNSMKGKGFGSNLLSP